LTRLILLHVSFKRPAFHRNFTLRSVFVYVLECIRRELHSELRNFIGIPSSGTRRCTEELTIWKKGMKSATGNPTDYPTSRVILTNQSVMTLAMRWTIGIRFPERADIQNDSGPHPACSTYTRGSFPGRTSVRAYIKHRLYCCVRIRCRGICLRYLD
jgi:hypothetical protein